MPPSDPQFEARQDAELRNVPLPKGLLGDLRRAALSDDEGLDEALRQLAVPSGLMGRLRKAALIDDAGLDAAVGDVRLPTGLAERLRRSVLVEDDGLDAAVREVPLPGDLPSRSRRVVIGRMRLTRLTQWATAVSLVIAIGFSYVGAMIAFLAATYPNRGPRPELASRQTSDSSAPSYYGELEMDVATGPGGGGPGDGLADGPMVPVPEVELFRFERPRPMAMAAVSELFDPARPDAMLEPGLCGWDPGLLFSHGYYDELPELEKLTGPVPRGIDPPWVPGFDWPYYVRYGVYPFVSPAAHQQLKGSVVPLDVDSASYELMRRHLQHDGLPKPEDVRIEEFLAAVDYGLPQPKDRPLGLSVGGGPSPFGQPGTRLLYVGVQGRRIEDQRRRPVHLVLTVDVSASMSWGGRLEMVRRALTRTAQRMGPDDHLSLVAFSEGAEVVVEDVRHGESDQFLAAVEWLSLRGSTNLGAGLREAYALAQRVPAPQGTDVRVVLLTDGLTELGRGTAELIEQRLAEAAGRGILLEVLDLRPSQRPDPQLASFARSGGGSVHSVTSADEVRWALREITTGSAQVIAEEARLKITFNPKTVVAYRLFGHEGKLMEGLMPARPEADFRAGQSAGALYEIYLNPKGGDEIATVELTWREPHGGSTHRQKLHDYVRRGQFGSSFVKAPLSVQQAALVAETAEVLRNSPFGLQRGSSRVRALARILEMSAAADPKLRQRPTFIDFLLLLEQAMRAKPYRSGEIR